MTSPYGSSPGASSYASSHAFNQTRHHNKSTYVQRWKVLRDRNKSLPKLDFNAKASGIPKKFQGPGSFSRSYTYDSMKLPSISTCSVITGVSGKTAHSDGYRRKDSMEKRNLQTKTNLRREERELKSEGGSSSAEDQKSESYTDLSTRDYSSLAVALSKSLQSLAQEDSQQKEQTKNGQSSNSHRYENITYKKHLLKRHKGTEANDKTKRSKGTHAQNKPEKDRHQKAKDREFVFVRNHTKLSPNLLAKNETIEGAYKKGQKSFNYTMNNPTSPCTDDFTNHSDTVTVTPDDVTIYSSLTHPKSPSSKSNITYPKSPVNMYTPISHGTV